MIFQKAKQRTCINIETGLLQGETFFDWLGPKERQIALISDTEVAALYGEALVQKLVSKGWRAKLFRFPAGEKSKCLETVQQLQDQLLNWGFTREDLIIACGGGVVTDLAGFVAATLFRGVALINIPTTLLAMVDASVGGKTGVNTAYGKNLVGAFLPAEAVLIDPDLLKTLSHDCFLEGVVEMLKHGAIVDEEYFTQLVQQADHLDLEKAIAGSCRIKTALVEADSEERNGQRRLLNFGHTVGHALEKVTHYRLSHGEAVAIGMQLEGLMSCRLGVLPVSEWERLVAAFERFGIACQLPEGIEFDHLWEAMTYDKKAAGRKPRIVLLEAIGRAAHCKGAYCQEVNRELVREVFLEGVDEVNKAKIL